MRPDFFFFFFPFFFAWSSLRLPDDAISFSVSDTSAGALSGAGRDCVARGGVETVLVAAAAVVVVVVVEVVDVVVASVTADGDESRAISSSSVSEAAAVN